MKLNIEINEDNGIVTIACPFCATELNHDKIPEWFWCEVCQKRVSLFKYEALDTA